MASSGVVNPTFKPFDFASNDVLCSYDDFNQEIGSSNVISDLETRKDFSKDFQGSRMTRCSSGVVNNQLNDTLCRDTLTSVEKCMKQHSDDIMCVLQSISSRLSHLELYCYNVDKSVGEIHLNLRRDYEETDSRLASLDRHLEEVSRSVQILRDKKELAENQKVLANLELSSVTASQRNVERSESPSSDHQKNDEKFELQNQHLAIVLHHQVPPQQQSLPTRSVEVAPQHTMQQQRYFLTPAPYHVQIQASQGQYLTSGTLYHTPQYQQPDINCLQFQQVPAQAPVHHFIQHPQQTQQPQRMISAQIPIQQPPTPAPSRPQSAYPEAAPTSIHMQPPFYSMAQQAATRANAMSNGNSRGPVQLQTPSQHINENSGAAYLSATPAYVMYGNEELKKQSHYPQGSHPPASTPRQHVSLVRNPHNELISNLVVNSGFRPDHLVPVIHQTMEQSRESVNCNSVILNKVNVRSSGLHRGSTG